MNTCQNNQSVLTIKFRKKQVNVAMAAALNIAFDQASIQCFLNVYNFKKTKFLTDHLQLLLLTRTNLLIGGATKKLKL